MTLPHPHLSIAAGELSPIGGFIIPQLVKEETIFTPTEWTILRSAITTIAVGYLLGAEALRRRQMEPAYKKDKKMSAVGMGLVAIGVGAALYALWNINRI